MQPIQYYKKLEVFTFWVFSPLVSPHWNQITLFLFSLNIILIVEKTIYRTETNKIKSDIFISKIGLLITIL